MTNEEAIEILTAAGKRRAKPELFDALDMGIAALENQFKCDGCGRYFWKHEKV